MLPCQLSASCLITAKPAGPEIHHFDLYRLEADKNLGRLQLEASFKEAVCLVEWAERLPDSSRPADRLDIHITPISVRLRLSSFSSDCAFIASHACLQVQPQMAESCTHVAQATYTLEDQADAEEKYTDKRQREIRLIPHGDTMTQRCQQIMEQA